MRIWAEAGKLVNVMPPSSVPVWPDPLPRAARWAPRDGESKGISRIETGRSHDGVDGKMADRGRHRLGGCIHAAFRQTDPQLMRFVKPPDGKGRNAKGRRKAVDKTVVIGILVRECQRHGRLKKLRAAIAVFVDGQDFPQPVMQRTGMPGERPGQTGVGRLNDGRRDGEGFGNRRGADEKNPVAGRAWGDTSKRAGWSASPKKYVPEAD